MDRPTSLRVLVEVQETPGNGHTVGDRSYEAIVEATRLFLENVRADAGGRFTAAADVHVSANVNGSCIIHGSSPTRRFYSVAYDHEYGTDLFLVRSDHEPNEAEIIEAFHLNFEPEKDESLIITEHQEGSIRDL